MKRNLYPELEIDLKKILHNTKLVVDDCKKHDISICGVVKGINGDIDVAKTMIKGGCVEIGDSRVHHLIALKDIDVPLLLTRIPMLSEVPQLVEFVDISLNSEIEVIEEINKYAKLMNKRHKVILMCDLGDLREGYFDINIVADLALYIEKNLDYVELYGIGTNLGCYGSIKPTIEKMEDLIDIAEVIEKKIARKLDVISGGATSTLPLVFNDSIPKRINHLRIGECILLANDLNDFWNISLDNYNKDTIILKAELVEVKNKPTYPIGEIFIDAFGNKPEYFDEGIRKRGILAVGKQDFAYHDKLIPIDKNIKIVGSSSDHLIIDLQESDKIYSIGDIISFRMYYPPMLYLSDSKSVYKKIIY